MKELTAGIIIKDKKVLLVHNAKHGLRIEPPGGKRDEGEVLEDSVVRELAEELGIKVAVKGLLGVFKTHSPEGDFKVHMFLCEIIEGEPKILEPDKIPAFGWYTVDEIEALREEGTLVPNMVEALETVRGLIEKM